MSRRFLIPLILALPVAVLAAPAPKDPPSIKTPEGGVAAQAVETTEDGAEKLRAGSSNNLKQIAIAFHNYCDTNGKMPTDITDKTGKAILSWRVHLLPYVEQAQIYNQFKLDEPWDGPNNKKLLDKMPAVFASPRVKVKETGHTVYLGFAGPGSLFEPGKQLNFPAAIADGTSNTIMVVESSTAYPWTRPIDLPFDPKGELPAFGKAYGSQPLVAMCDGSVRTVDVSKVSATTLKAAITIAGGEVLGSDW